MGWKKGNPGCPCCCTPELISGASAASKWINPDEEWTLVSSKWQTSTAGAVLLGSQKLDAAANQKVVYTVEIPDGDTVRFLFLYRDLDNYYCVQWDRSANLFSLIRRESGTETVIHTLVSADYPDDPLKVQLTLCFNACELRAEFKYWNGSTYVSYGRFGHPNLAADSYYYQYDCPTDAETYVGVIAQIATGTFTLESIEYKCDEACTAVCLECEDNWGPPQIQLTMSGFTGGCAYLNGTWVLDPLYWNSGAGCGYKFVPTPPSDFAYLLVYIGGSSPTWYVRAQIVDLYGTLVFSKTESSRWNCNAFSNYDLGVPNTTFSNHGCEFVAGHAYITSLL